MHQTLGVLIAIVSSSIGGSAAAVTRYLAQATDPITLSILRWVIGFAVVLPVALIMRVKWPPRADWPAVALLGLSFFGGFFILYNIASAPRRRRAARSRSRRCRCRRCWSTRSFASNR